MDLAFEKHVSDFFDPVIVNWDTVGRLRVSREDSTKWKNFSNKGSILVEEAFLLYSLIRMTKPEYVVDLGTYVGISPIFMAEGLRDNGFGDITTIEYHESAYKVAVLLFERLNYLEIDARYMRAEDFVPDRKIDFLFLDTETADRVSQFNHLLPHMSDQSWAVFHDAGACKDIDTIKHPYLHFKSVRELRVFNIRKG